MSFKDQVVIITAASKGMGAAIAEELASQDAKVVLMSRSEEILQLAQLLDGIGMIGSTENPSDLQQLVNLAMDKYGKINGVVNNTGHPPKGDILALTDEQWLTGLNLVLMNVIRLARLVTPHMVKQGSGSILNISTFSAFEPSPDFPVSSTFRAALGSFMKLFSDQYGPDNIRMNNLLPGFVDSYAINDGIRNKIPLKRPGTTKEIAKTVSFLLSDDAGYITGQNIRVDGGLTRSI